MFSINFFHERNSPVVGTFKLFKVNYVRRNMAQLIHFKQVISLLFKSKFKENVCNNESIYIPISTVSSFKIRGKKCPQFRGSHCTKGAKTEITS